MRALCIAAAVALLAACNRGSAPPPHGLPGGTSPIGVAAGAGPSAGHGSSGAGAGGAGGSGGAGGASNEPQPSSWPTPLATCPKIAPGTVSFSFAGNMPSRVVELRRGKSGGGPLVIVWHGENQSPAEALQALIGTSAISDITSKGGVIAAPYHDPNAGNAVWYASQGSFTVLDDFTVMDEIAACVDKQMGIDRSRVHVVGFELGAVQAALSAILRSGYVASAVIHSGGIAGMPMEQAPTATYPFMVLYGGPGDVSGMQDYAQSSTELAALAAKGMTPFSAAHATVLCNHNGGPVVATDAISATLRFMRDTAFGAGLSYGGALPSPYPAYCALQQ